MATLHWSTLTGRYLDERQCLASFVAWQAAEVIAEVKPANLINIIDRKLACGRNIFTLWDKYHSMVFEQTDVRALVLKQQAHRRLVLIYHPAMLEQTLKHRVVKQTLRKLRYDYEDVETALAHLQVRLNEEDFPHEIGFFLGYPIKDVLAFMGILQLPLTASGPWKMYGKIEDSLARVKTYLRAREQVLDRLDKDFNPMHLFSKKKGQTFIRPLETFSGKA